jgi:epsilon-lactone hydrolase
MASWQAHVLDAALRATVKRRLKHNTDLAKVRETLNRGGLPAPKGVAFRADRLGGVEGEWASAPEAAPDAPVLIYLHGGGYFACSPQTHRPLTGWFAKAGFSVFAPDYRLAPENPYPAALDDAYAVYLALRAAGHAAERIVVAGDSAGGGLALALMQRLRDAGQAQPAGAVLFSPWTDLAATGASVRENVKKDAMFWAPGLPQGAAFYLGGMEARTPGASPHYGDFRGLPPLLIHVGARELLRDDAVRAAEKVRAAGGRAELLVWPVVPHVWQLVHGFVPEARESLEIASRFLMAAVAETAAQAPKAAA